MKGLDFLSKESEPMISKLCHPQNVMIHIEKGLQILSVYEEKVPTVGCHYARINYKHSMQHCIAQPIKTVAEAVRIYGLLTKCEHPYLLKPTGLWLCDNDKKNKETNRDKEEKPRDKEEKPVIVVEAVITFPFIDGALADVPREDIFVVENDCPECIAYGFSNQGSRILCDILAAVDYINGLYGSTTEPAIFPLSPLRINFGRMVYTGMAEREYHVLLLADFFAQLPTQQRKMTRGGRRDPTVDDIKLANWNAVGNCLRSLCRSYRVKPNMELEQFINVLNGKSLKGGQTLNYNDLLWEPGLWSARTKIIFIREVFWCVENTKGNEEKLKVKKPSLGLVSCIKKLGFDNNDANILDSVMFLRKKIVAHQDSSYGSYTGDNKDDVGTDKRTIEMFVQKSSPDYMIKLVKEVRTLNWIKESPITQKASMRLSLFSY